MTLLIFSIYITTPRFPRLKNYFRSFHVTGTETKTLLLLNQAQGWFEMLPSNEASKSHSPCSSSEATG